MKTNAELVTERRIIIERTGADGGQGWIPGLDRKRPSHAARVVWSDGAGWDHVSVSWPNRCPTWDEMAEVKRLFFHNDEACVQYHPAASDYVNDHPYCLHIWRWQDGEMPKPYTWMVGRRPGQTHGDLEREANAVLKGV